MNRLSGAAFIVACGSCVFAQTPSFDVASIRPAEPEQGRQGNARPHRIHTTPGNVVMRNASMTEAIQWAYGVEFYQVSGPAWMPMTRFDIVAKAAGPASEDEMRRMTQSLLASRFGLQTHGEDKEMAGMALLVAKDGPKMKPSAETGDSVFEPVPKKLAINMRRMSMHEFAALLSEPMRKPVLDFTGVPGTFDFTLDASKYAPPDPAPGQPHEDNDSYLVMRVLPEELGLRLEARKLSIHMLVIDHIEKTPTEN